MNEKVRQQAGILVAAALAADGLLHAYWTTGGLWPAKDRRTLSRLILDTDKPSLFEPIVVGPLACLLFVASLTTLARVGKLGRLGKFIPNPVLQIGILVIAAGLLIRGLQGIGITIRGDSGTSFYKLNVLVYTPVCLALSAAAVSAACSEHP